MENVFLRQMKPEELIELYTIIRRDFPSDERPPQVILKNQLKIGKCELLLLTDGQIDYAYALCTLGANAHTLILLFAVFEEYRGKGLGSTFMHILAQRMKDKLSMIVEVEIPEKASSEIERVTRGRRIAFYERLGFVSLTDIRYAAWNVPLMLMVLPLRDSLEQVRRDILQIIPDIYAEQIGHEFLKKIQLSEWAK